MNQIQNYSNCQLQISGDCKKLSLIKTVKLSGGVTDVAYSPDGSYLATADSNRKVTLLDQHYEKANSREWGFHTAKVTNKYDTGMKSEYRTIMIGL